MLELMISIMWMLMSALCLKWEDKTKDSLRIDESMSLKWSSFEFKTVYRHFIWCSSKLFGLREWSLLHPCLLFHTEIVHNLDEFNIKYLQQSNSAVQSPEFVLSLCLLSLAALAQLPQFILILKNWNQRWCCGT